MTVTETEEVGQDFARLMSGAADAAAPEVDPEAPFGWTTDRETGERRPKRSPGRPRKSASAEELLAGEPLTKPEDGAPASGGSQPAPAAPRKEPPPPKGGVIATGG